MLAHMRTNISRRVAAAVIVPIALLGFAACGDDDKSDSDKESTSQESTDTADESPAAEDTATEEAPATGEEISNEDFADLVADGVEATTTARMKMEITSSGMVTTAEGVMDYTGDQPATQMSMTMPGGTAGGGEMEVIMLDGIIYMSMPGATQPGTYFKLDPKANPEVAKQMGGLNSLDMANMTKAFTDGLEKVETVGSEDVDGVEATHYVVTVNTKAAQSMLGGIEGAEGAEIPAELTYDIWLDDEGRIVKMEADMGSTGSMTMNVFEHGADVSVKAPPADKVQEMPGAPGAN